MTLLVLIAKLLLFLKVLKPSILPLTVIQQIFHVFHLTFRLAESVDIPYKPSLDYDKIKTDLLTLPERKRAFLLQALRWVCCEIIEQNKQDLFLFLIDS